MMNGHLRNAPLVRHQFLCQEGRGAVATNAIELLRNGHELYQFTPEP
jgi:uncharacterized protein YlaI